MLTSMRTGTGRAYTPTSPSGANRPTYISLLSSSPSRPDYSDGYGLAGYDGGSPLPVRKKSSLPSFKPGSRAAPIPQGAVTGFQKASALAIDLDSDDDSANLKVHVLGERPVNELNRSTEDDAKGKDITRAPESVESQETSRYFSKELAPREITGPAPQRPEVGHVNEHVPREKPATHTPLENNETAVTDDLETNRSEACQPIEDSVPAFAELVGAVGYHKNNSSGGATLAIVTETKVPTRGPKVDEKAAKSESSDVKVLGAKSRPKHLPKKPLTITARAIANAQAFIEHDPDDGSRDLAQLPAVDTLDFTALCKDKAKAKVKANNQETSPTKKTSRGPEPKSSRKSRKTPSRQTPLSQKLLSPMSAIQRMDGQQFAFGSCSQIERDEEATYFKDLEIALKVSAVEGAASLKSQKMPECSGLHQYETSRSLWSVGARGDGNGLLLDPEAMVKPKSTFDLPFNPTSAHTTFDGPLKANLAQEVKQTNEKSTNISDQNSFSSNSNPKIRLSSAQSTKPAMVFNPKQSTASGASVISNIMKKHTSTQIRPHSTSSSTKAAAGRAMAAETDQPPKDSRNPKPPASKTHGQDPALPKKRRGRPPKHLDSVEEHAAKRKKSSEPQDGLEKPADQSDVIQVDEIEDKESPSPSPPRLQSARGRVQLKLSHAEDATDAFGRGQIINDAALTKDEETQTQLFALITDAVRSAPRSKDLKNPSWYEKILLYDPIVLEDFTEWLNATGLRTNSKEVGTSNSTQDQIKIEPKMVQRWCQRNGVCCLWKKER